jgi:hypothetical protein
MDLFNAKSLKTQLFGIIPIHRVAVHVIEVTPEIARRIRDEWNFPNQRSIKVSNVDRLAVEMSYGWFVVGTPIFVCVMPDGTRYLVNGNHTCEAIISSGAAIPLTVIELQVADFNEAARVYSTFDIHKARSWVDTLKATGTYEDFYDPAKVASAVGVIMGEFKFGTTVGSTTASRTARTQKMAEYKEAASIIAGCMSGGPRITTSLLKRAAVLAVALESARYQPTAAIEFWRDFVLDDGLAAKDPRKALARWLQNNKSTGGTKNFRLQAFAAARAWNLHFVGETVDHIKPTTMASFSLKGTPWK